jgi:hypothetical protein
MIVLPSEILAQIRYQPETGRFFRRQRKVVKPDDITYNKRYENRECPRTPFGRRQDIRINGQLFKAHRVAYVCMTGRWPTKTVDHINRDPSDNRWVNLREATISDQNCNRGPRPGSPTGVKGIYLGGKYWIVDISYGRKRHRKCFKLFYDAVSHYNEIALVMQGPFAAQHQIWA